MLNKPALPDKVLTALVAEKGVGGATIVDEIAPALPIDNVNADEFKYYSITPVLRTDFETRRPAGTEANIVEIERELIPSSVDLHRLKDRVTDDEVSNEPEPLDYFADSAFVTTEQIKLRFEKNAHDALVETSSATIPGANAGVKWDAATPKILVDIVDAMYGVLKNCGHWPNKLVIPPVVGEAFESAADIADMLKYTTQDVLTKGLIPVVKNMKILMPGRLEDTAALGATPVPNHVWSTDMVLAMYVNPAAGGPNPAAAQKKRITAMYQFRRKVGGTNAEIYKYRHEDLMCWDIEARLKNALKWVCKKCVWQIRDCIT